MGRTLPVAGGLVAIAAASWVITHAGGRAEYAAAQLAYNTLYLFLTPFLLGTAAAIDRLGRVAAALGGITLVGSAFGPVLGGAVVGAGGHAALGMLTAGCIVLAALVLTPICLRLDGE